MKSVRTLISLCLLVTAATLFAQTERLMKVNIPFAFAAEDHSLPAGQYFVYTVTWERSIRITSVDGKHTAIVNTLPNRAGAPSENSRLVFHKYDKEYFLTQVWSANDNVVRTPMTGKREKEMELAHSGSYERTTILAFDGR
jgi:hypothetical protein